MKVRWTIKQLDTYSNKKLILSLITERALDLNPYAPLAIRLSKLYSWVEKNIPEGVK